MKKAILIAILLLAAARPSSAQALTEYGQARNVVIDGDTVVLVQLSPSFVFRKAVDTRRFARLIYNLKRVYPIAKEANATLHAMEAHMETLATKREKQIFVKEMERALKKKYTPVLKKMTLSQGKLLIKLIDRETDQTSYELVKELRGGFRAFREIPLDRRCFAVAHGRDHGRQRTAGNRAQAFLKPFGYVDGVQIPFCSRHDCFPLRGARGMMR